MAEKEMERKLRNIQRHEVRVMIVRTLARAYGNEGNWVSMQLFARQSLGLPLEPELRYLKELGYISEQEDKLADRRQFQATAKGYALWCGDIEDASVPVDEYES